MRTQKTQEAFKSLVSFENILKPNWPNGPVWLERPPFNKGRTSCQPCRWLTLWATKPVGLSARSGDHSPFPGVWKVKTLFKVILISLPFSVLTFHKVQEVYRYDFRFHIITNTKMSTAEFWYKGKGEYIQFSEKTIKYIKYSSLFQILIRVGPGVIHVFQPKQYFATDRMH